MSFGRRDITSRAQPLCQVFADSGGIAGIMRANAVNHHNFDGIAFGEKVVNAVKFAAFDFALSGVFLFAAFQNGFGYAAPERRTA